MKKAKEKPLKGLSVGIIASLAQGLGMYPKIKQIEAALSQKGREAYELHGG